MRALALAAALVLAGPALADGGTLVTVTGSVTATNRGPFNPAADRLFALNEARFEKAMAFSFDALSALPQATVEADYPAGSPVATFQGPRLADVLEAAGADGTRVALRALDGYAVDQPIEDLTAAGAVLAIRRDGLPLGMGDFGPAQLVFPRRDRPDLADMNDDWWIWQIYHIDVK